MPEVRGAPKHGLSSTSQDAELRRSGCCAGEDADASRPGRAWPHRLGNCETDVLAHTDWDGVEEVVRQRGLEEPRNCRAVSKRRLGKCGPASMSDNVGSHFYPKLAEFGRIWPGIGPIWRGFAGFLPMSENVAYSVPNSADIGQLRAKSSQIRPNPRHKRHSRSIEPNLADSGG